MRFLDSSMLSVVMAVTRAVQEACLKFFQNYIDDGSDSATLSMFHEASNV